MSANVDEFLVHYGVKGMRWGVTKKDSGSTNPKAWSTKKKVLIGAGIVAGLSAAVVGTKVGVDFAAAAKDYGNILNKENFDPFTFASTPSLRSMYKNSPDVSEKMQKGHEFIRRSKVMETKLDTRAYALASAKGAENYGEFDFGKHLLSLRPNRDIKVASYRQSVDALAENFSKKEVAGLLRRDTLGRRLYQDLAMNPIDRATLGYANLQSRNFDTSNPVTIKYLNTMISKGFSAVRDIIDGGDAVVLFDSTVFDVTSKLN